jgi:hypothetical protein
VVGGESGAVVGSKWAISFLPWNMPREYAAGMGDGGGSSDAYLAGSYLLGNSVTACFTSELTDGFISAIPKLAGRVSTAGGIAAGKDNL